MTKSSQTSYQSIHHPKFNKELKDFCKKKCSNNVNAEQTLKSAEKLVKKEILEQSGVIAKNLFGLATGFSLHKVYWLKLQLLGSGLKKGQMPKCYLFFDEGIFSFLCLDSHIDNYKDSELKKKAKKRLKELLVHFNACK